jgi:WXG100 family type VII secretion target
LRESRPDPYHEANMAQAIVDPAELRRFAQNLKRFNNELQGQMGVLHGQLMNLGQSWRDREQQKFVEEFEQTMQAVARFVEATNEHIPFLMRKAQRIEEYLQQR